MKHTFEIDLDKIEFSDYMKKALEVNQSEHFYIWIMTCVALCQNEIWGNGYDTERENVSIYNVPYFFNDTENAEAIEIEKIGDKFMIDFCHQV